MPKETINSLNSHNLYALFYYDAYYGPKGIMQPLSFYKHNVFSKYTEIINGGAQIIAVYKKNKDSLLNSQGTYKRGMKISLNQKVLSFDDNLAFNMVTNETSNHQGLMSYNEEEVEILHIYTDTNKVDYVDSPPIVLNPSLADKLHYECVEVLQKLFERGHRPSSFKEFYGLTKHEELLNSIVAYIMLSGLLENKETDVYTFLRENYYEKTIIEERFEFINKVLRDTFYGTERSFTVPLSNPKPLDDRDVSEEAGKEYRNTINSIPYLEPKIKNELLSKVDLYEKLSDSSTKASFQEYLDVIQNLPWNKYSEISTDFKSIKSEVNNLSFGLDGAKEKIYQYVAANINKKGNNKGSVLCFVGPPGVGKTYFAQILGEALKRKVESIALGGIDDVTILRGQRKGWVGAEPGQIIKSLIRADTMNPIIIFDEIDKISGNRGSQIQAALLEILDPEQNKKFKDAYIDFPVDISNVLFVTTANSIFKLPAALRDRLDIIEFTGYTQKEKKEIIDGYMLPKILKNIGIEPQEFSLTQEATNLILKNSKYEPGVRTIERYISELAMKYLVKKLEDNLQNIVVDSGNLESLLDLHHDEKFNPDRSIVGEVNIMWASSAEDVFGEIGGRSTLQTRSVKGSGEPTLTGSIQDVFKEAIQVAIGFLRSNQSKYAVENDYFKEHDFLVHIPETATKKDGPSAGLATAVCLYSTILQKPIPQNIAITGEIDLAGNVLPVGGIKQKISGSVQAGIKKFVLPKDNEQDYLKIFNEYSEGNLEVFFVATFDEALPIVFG